MKIAVFTFKVVKLFPGVFNYGMLTFSYKKIFSKNVNQGVREKMVQLTNQERVWICLEYACVHNDTEVKRRWHLHFPGVVAPTLKTIIKNVQKLNHNDVGKACS